MEKQSPLLCQTDKKVYRVHILKTVNPYYHAIISGKKTLEIRKFDRDFQVGDILFLIEYQPEENKMLTTTYREITHVMTHDDHEGIQEGYVALSLSKISTTIAMALSLSSELSSFELPVLISNQKYSKEGIF